MSSSYSEAGFLGVIIRRDLRCNCSMSERGGSIEHSATEKRVTHLVSGISVRHVVQSHGTHRGEMARVVTTTKLQKKKKSDIDGCFSVDKAIVSRSLLIKLTLMCL